MVVFAGLCHADLQAADKSASTVAEKEIARRNARMHEARTLMTEAALLQSKGEFDQAASNYRQAYDLIPEAPMSQALKVEARNGYSHAAVAQAAKYAAAARYADARALLQSVLAEDFDPANREAKELQEKLEDPDRYEPALTPKHLEDVAKVEKELRMASGFTTLGDYRRAIEHYQKVLLIDPYNSAARRGMERAEQFKSEYYDAARDHYRAKALAELDRQWEDQIPVADLSSLFGGGANLGAVGAKENLLLKMRTMLIPVLDLQAASLEEVIEFLRIRTRELDPDKRGVSFVLKVDPDTAARPVTLNMAAVPVEEVLRYITEMTGTVYRPEEYAVIITSRAEKSTALITRTYRVPPSFMENAPAGAPAPGSAPQDPFATAPPGGGSALQIRRLGAKEFLESRGVTFPEGGAAQYNPSTSLLTVRNTAENMTMVDALVEEAVTSTPKQVEVTVKILEVNETRLKELGFDWLLGQFNVPGSNRIFTSGGTVGNQRGSSFTDQEFPFAVPGGGATGAVPPVGINPITAGLRSSGAILAVPSIDQLIGRVTLPAVDSRSPGTFAVSGVFTDPQFQVVIRALNQCKGVDFLAAPSVVTKSGQRATISLIREFIYPTEFDPPQIPQSIGQLTIGGVRYTSGPPPVNPVTPTTPTAFEKRDVGITLEVEPVIGQDNSTVDLSLAPTSVEFEGFIDYGSPILMSGANAPPNTVATENHIFQPIFRTNKLTTSVSVWDGNTIVIGGVMYEKHQDIQDKVPVLGNIPLVGRAFQSKVKLSERKNVIMFVSVRVLDPSGNPVSRPPDGPAAASR